METVKISDLSALEWRAANCQITSVSCKCSYLSAGTEISAMLVGGTVTLELRKNCGVRFAWRAEQLVEHFGSTPGFAYSVDAAKAGTSQQLIFVGDAGMHVPLSDYSAVIQQLGSDIVTLWSPTVSHYLRSLR